MESQTLVVPYSEWCRACAAIEIALRVNNRKVRLTPQALFAYLDDGDKEVGSDAFCWAMAVAETLGLDRRLRMTWPAKPTSGTGTHSIRHGNLQAWAVKMIGGWEATVRVYGEANDLIRVYGHPSLSSAIEHLERLLGRADYREVMYNDTAPAVMEE